jgi:hypothetical protein
MPPNKLAEPETIKEIPVQEVAVTEKPNVP